MAEEKVTVVEQAAEEKRLLPKRLRLRKLPLSPLQKRHLPKLKLRLASPSSSPRA